MHAYVLWNFIFIFQICLFEKTMCRSILFSIASILMTFYQLSLIVDCHQMSSTEDSRLLIPFDKNSLGIYTRDPSWIVTDDDRERVDRTKEVQVSKLNLDDKSFIYIYYYFLSKRITKHCSFRCLVIKDYHSWDVNYPGISYYWHFWIFQLEWRNA